MNLNGAPLSQDSFRLPVDARIRSRNYGGVFVDSELGTLNQMTIHPKISVFALEICLFLLGPAGRAIAQSCGSQQPPCTVVAGVVSYESESDSGNVCGNATSPVPAKYSCSGKWEDSGNAASGTGSVRGTARYGFLKAKAHAAVRMAASEEFAETITRTASGFGDLLSFPTLPNGTFATLSATITVSGTSSVSNSVSALNAYGELGLGCSATNFLECTSSCTTGVVANGGCTISQQVQGGSGSVVINAALGCSATSVMEVDTSGSATASCDYDSGKNGAWISSLTLTDANGKSYEIVAASGHKYPE